MTRSDWLRIVPVLLCASAAVHAQEKVRIYAVTVGTNVSPSSKVLPLSYADDDAARLFELFSEMDATVRLLGMLDSSSQKAHPAAAAAARSATLKTLTEVLAELEQRMKQDVLAGDVPVLFFSYSGHGYLDDAGQPRFALDDGSISQKWLYEKVLTNSSARLIHLLIDACNAEAVVRPRGQAAPTPAEIEDFLSANTLARFPNVGALIASSAEGQAHEWARIRGGVFTHQLLSAMRGAADVNADGRVEYSEIQAFIAAANRSVSDPRARLQVIARAPPLNERQPLADRRWFKHSGTLAGRWAQLQHFWIEDDKGTRLLDAHTEEGVELTLTLPAGRILYLANDTGDAPFMLEVGKEMRREQLVLKPRGIFHRGRLDDGLQAGLFSIQFGPLYYRGFVDREGAPSVDFSPSPLPSVDVLAGWRRPAGIASLCASVVALGSAIGFAGSAVVAKGDFDRSEFPRTAAVAADRYATHRDVAIGSAAAAVALGGLGALLIVIGNQ